MLCWVQSLAGPFSGLTEYSYTLVVNYSPVSGGMWPNFVLKIQQVLKPTCSFPFSPG